MKTVAEAAAELGLSIHTLHLWRAKGTGPEYVKLGKAVRYTDEALEAFKLRNTRSKISDTAAA